MGTLDKSRRTERLAGRETTGVRATIREAIGTVKASYQATAEARKRKEEERRLAEDQRILTKLLKEVEEAGIDIHNLGAVCEFFESRGRGSMKITRDRNPQNAKFPSIGRWQTNRLHGMRVAAKIAEGTKIRVNIQNQGSLEDVWRKLYARLGDAKFRIREEQAIQEVYYDRQVEIIEEKTGIRVTRTSPGFQNMIWSMAIQHGPDGKRIYPSLLKMPLAERIKIGTPADVGRKIEDKAILQIYKDRVSLGARLAGVFEQNRRASNSALPVGATEDASKNVFASLGGRYREELLLIRYLVHADETPQIPSS